MIAEAVWEEVGRAATREATSRAIVLGSRLAAPSPAPATFSVGATAFIALTSAVAGGWVAWNLRDWLRNF